MLGTTLTVKLITISMLTLQWQSLHEQIKFKTSKLYYVYDYLIIGGGTAGSIVASRLSSNPSITVLLLEAGEPQSTITDMPSNALMLLRSEYNYQYKTVPQKNSARGFKNQQAIHECGKVLGGSSTTNWMIYNRGNRRTYDNWSVKYGAKGWSFEEVLPYFLISENNTEKNFVETTPAYHSTGGPLTVSSTKNPDPILLKFQESANREGYPTIDPNGPKKFGTFINQQTIKDGVRASTATAYLEPNSHRKNLHVVTGANVEKILFKRFDNYSEPRAHSVLFTYEGVLHKIQANREIILSAGAISSPQILMLSGIGHSDHLSEFDIPLVADLPVGDNYHDHPGVMMNFNITNQSDANPQPIFNIENLYDFFHNRNGPLSRIPVSVTTINSKYNDDNEWPDTSVVLFVGTVGTNVTRIVENYKESHLKEWIDYWEPFVGKSYLIFYANILRPRSRGTIRLSSSNPSDYPKIDPNYFSNEYDIKALVDGLKQGLKIVQNKYFKQYATIFPKLVPSCGNETCDFSGNLEDLLQCEPYLRCTIEQLTSTYHHPVGTCRIGTVVDEKLRVRKVTALRVIDASIIPEIPNSPTYAATIMIAEKGAKFVLDDYIMA